MIGHKASVGAVAAFKPKGRSFGPLPPMQDGNILC